MLIERRVPADLSHLRELMMSVDEVCAATDAPRDFRADLRLVVEEAVVNVMKHGYAGLPTGELKLSLQLAVQEGRPAVRVDLQDHGHPFDPLSAAAPDTTLSVDDRPIGGLGVMLMRQLSDLQTYRHDAAHGNWLTLVKFLPVTPAA